MPPQSGFECHPTHFHHLGCCRQLWCIDSSLLTLSCAVSCYYGYNFEFCVLVTRQCYMLLASCMLRVTVLRFYSEVTDEGGQFSSIHNPQAENQHVDSLPLPPLTFDLSREVKMKTLIITLRANERSRLW